MRGGLSCAVLLIGRVSHDHRPGARADRSAPCAHVVRAIENEAIIGKAVDIWGVEGGLGIVNLQIEGRIYPAP